MKTEPAIDVANYLLAQSSPECGDYISNLKLQKLLYYAQGVSLAMLDAPLFDEDILNWEHGPVVRSVYNHFRENGADIIVPPADFDGSMFAPEQKEVMNEVYDVFGQFSAWKLRDMTHQEKPWASTNRNDVIPKELIKEYFLQAVVEK